MRLNPQCKQLLKHLKQTGSISNVEAQAIYKVRALPRRVSDLEALGVRVNRVTKHDATGQRYVRYHYIEAPFGLLEEAGAI
jgi:hypothetical protein